VAAEDFTGRSAESGSQGHPFSSNGFQEFRYERETQPLLKMGTGVPSLTGCCGKRETKPSRERLPLIWRSKRSAA
jgi:hypothetical protein